LVDDEEEEEDSKEVGIVDDFWGDVVIGIGVPAAVGRGEEGGAEGEQGEISTGEAILDFVEDEKRMNISFFPFFSQETTTKKEYILVN
jgi:hypothetical protein